MLLFVSLIYNSEESLRAPLRTETPKMVLIHEVYVLKMLYFDQVSLLSRQVEVCPAWVSFIF